MSGITGGVSARGQRGCMRTDGARASFLPRRSSSGFTLARSAVWQTRLSPLDVPRQPDRAPSGPALFAAKVSLRSSPLLPTAPSPCPPATNFGRTPPHSAAPAVVGRPRLQVTLTRLSAHASCHASCHAPCHAPCPDKKHGKSLPCLLPCLLPCPLPWQEAWQETW